MHITAEHGDQHVTLHLRGEFDTFYCADLDKEVAAIQKAGIPNVVLNLRWVKFINSTALGAIIKASKALAKAGGGLAISSPSPFCKDIIEKVGLDRVIQVAASDADAVAALCSGETAASDSTASPDDLDPSSVIFRLVDEERLRHFVEQAKATNPVHNHAFGSNWAGLGRMSGLDADGIRFVWDGGGTGLTAFDMGQMLAVGTQLKTKFRLPLLKSGFVEATVAVTLLEERQDGVKVGCTFEAIDDDAREAVGQYSKDMAFLKEELRRATE
jgi:anti-anti-sigma factor